MLPVIAVLMSGIARIEARVTKTVITPMITIVPTMARGTLRAGSCTSSAIEPAASKAEERPAHERHGAEPAEPQPVEAAVRAV